MWGFGSGGLVDSAFTFGKNVRVEARRWRMEKDGSSGLKPVGSRASTQDRFIARSTRLLMVLVMTTMTATQTMMVR